MITNLAAMNLRTCSILRSLPGSWRGKVFHQPMKITQGTEVGNENGDALIFRQTAADTGGQLLEMEAFYTPSLSPPPQHYHPSQEEHFEILTGALNVLLGSERKTYQAGDSFVIPAGTSHSMYNSCSETTHVIWQTRPALDSEKYLYLLWGGSPRIEEGTPGWRRLLQYAVILRSYRAEVRLSKPSGPIQDLLLGLLASLGRLLGYRAWYDG